MEERLIPSKWKDPTSWAKMSEPELARCHAAFAQYARNTKYRRAFICNLCYQQLDNYSGAAEILTLRGPKTFNLAGSSRGGKAAVYDHAKWSRYQERLYRTMLEHE